MAYRFWEVVCRYGHVGQRNEVSVARYLVTDDRANCITVMDLAKDMPGVKSRGVQKVRQINLEEWQLGKNREAENFYLQRLGVGRNRNVS